MLNTEVDTIVYVLITPQFVGQNTAVDIAGSK